MLLNVDLNLLRSLHALLEAGSVTGAAQSLGITQAAASNALRRLREHLGDELLVRSGSRMRPTPLAERLHPQVIEAMRAAAQVLGEPAPFVPAEAQAQLWVATSDHVETLVLEPLVAHLGRLAPGVSVRVEPFSPASVDRVRSGAVDLVLAPRAHMNEPLRVTRVLEEPYAAVVRRRHPALDGEQAAMSLQCFTEVEHVMVSPSGSGTTATATATDKALRALGRSRTVARIVPSFSQALLLVSTSDLLTIVPWSFAARFAGRLRLAVLQAPVELEPSRIDAGWSERLHDDPLHGWFRQQVVDVARRELERLLA